MNGLVIFQRKNIQTIPSRCKHLRTRPCHVTMYVDDLLHFSKGPCSKYLSVALGIQLFQRDRLKKIINLGEIKNLTRMLSNLVRRSINHFLRVHDVNMRLY